MRFFFKTAILNAVAIGFLAAFRAAGSDAYLETVGPPPLRFESVSPNNAQIIAELTLPKAKAIESPAMPSAPATSSAGVTLSATGDGIEPIPENHRGGIFGRGEKNAGGRFNSASELLSITPQMIDDYFKPTGTDVGGSTSFQPGQTIFVPAELGFVPPASGSRATYTSK